MEPSTILAALADLAPARSDRVLDVSGTGRPFVWLNTPDRAPRDAGTDRLAALDALHRDERVLRRGLAFVIGRTELDGRLRRVRLPLLSQPVRLERGLRGYRVVAAGDLELTPLIEDRALAARLEDVPGLAGPGWLTATGTKAWIVSAAQAAGLPVVDVRSTPGRGHGTSLTGVAAGGLYVVRDVLATGLRDVLRSWANRPGLRATALAGVYGDAEGRPAAPGSALPPGRMPATDQTPGTPADDELRSPLPLNADQREVLRRARTEPVTVVCGPPGSGKSHALVAVALDVVDRGGSVLVATGSPHAADVLGALFARCSGPTPVLFGDAESREAIAAELARGAAAGADEAQLSADAEAVRAAAERLGAVRAGIVAALETERLAAEVSRWEPLVPALAQDAPRAFDPEFDTASARIRLARATTPARGWWRRWRRSRAETRLRDQVGAGPTVPVDRLSAAVSAATAAQMAARLVASGGTDLTSVWPALISADNDLAAATGTAMRHRAASAQRWSGAARRSVGALGAALRAGRNRRRELLADLDGPALVRALPLWVGTVTDVEDLLPPIPGLFDLVVLDEAAHIDQLRAAPVLARARRALVAGDPQQLRFVSFVADVDVDATLRRHGLVGSTDRLDVPRVSAFDVAAGAAPVTWLSEHYRCVPHLITFAARRFYADRLTVATRHPATESADVIDVVRVSGAAVVNGVNQAEVAAAVGVVRKLAWQPPVGGIAVITPFRAQADALEAALLAEFPVEEIERLGLRSATVHGFQGSEADVVVVSLGLVDDDPSGRHRFVADPNLFNVMVTRARQRMTVITSLAAPDGLIADYLRYAAQPLPPVATAVPPGSDPPPPSRVRSSSRPGSPALSPSEPLSSARVRSTVGEATCEERTAGGGWTAKLDRELRRGGLPVQRDYPVGQWRVDLCVGAGPDAIGLICGVHPDGVEAHLERQRTLLRAGWRLYDAFASRWGGDPVRAALEVAALLR